MVHKGFAASGRVATTQPRVNLVGLATLLAIVWSIVAAPPATAADGTASAEQHCGLLMDSGTTVCVVQGEDLGAAILERTGRRVVDDAAGAIAGTGTGARVTYLMATLYDNSGFSGPFLSLFWSAPCGSGYVGWSDIGSVNYGRVSSFRGYSGCRVRIWENVGFSGQSLGFVADSSYVGAAMNDRTRSVQVTA